MSTPTANPTWLITGTSSGLGLPLSQLVLKKGHNLISISRHPEPDISLVNLANSNNPSNNTTDDNTTSSSTRNLHHIPHDLSNPSPTTLKSKITSILNSHPALAPTILVNNAGITTFSSLENMRPDHLSHVMTTNFLSPVYLIQAVLPYMRGLTTTPRPTSQSTSTTPQTNPHEKVIVNISSTQSLCTDPSESAYDASKHALEAMSGVLAGEVGTFGVRVIVVNLGSLRTGFAKGGERLKGEQGEKKVGDGDGMKGGVEAEAKLKSRVGSDLDPYADSNHPVARRMALVKKLVGVPGLARGDSDKTAAVLFDGIMRTKGTVVDDVLEAQRQRTVSEAGGSGIGRVERLVLGSDAQSKIERVLERLRGDVEGCRVVSGLVEADG